MKKTYVYAGASILFWSSLATVSKLLRERTVEDACPYRALSALSKNTSYLVGEGLAPPEKLKRKIKNGRGKPLPYKIPLQFRGRPMTVTNA